MSCPKGRWHSGQQICISLYASTSQICLYRRTDTAYFGLSLIMIGHKLYTVPVTPRQRIMTECMLYGLITAMCMKPILHDRITRYNLNESYRFKTTENHFCKGINMLKLVWACGDGVSTPLSVSYWGFSLFVSEEEAEIIAWVGHCVLFVWTRLGGGWKGPDTQDLQWLGSRGEVNCGCAV